MYRLRTYGFVRLLTVVTAFSMVMLTVAPALGYQGVHVSYEDWLRSQLRAPLEAEAEQSLADLEAERFTSVQSFLAAFVERVEAEGTDAGKYFGVEGLSGGYLVSYLESRFSHLAPDALPARSLLTIAPSTTLTTDRGAGAAVLGSSARMERSSYLAGSVGGRLAGPPAIALLSPLQPRAP